MNDKWIRQRYDCGCFAGLAPGPEGGRPDRLARGRSRGGRAGGGRTVQLGQHPPRARSEGRVNGITGGNEQAFVIDAAGQIAERLMDWTMLERDDELRAWLPTWKSDGGDARRFRRQPAKRFGDDECAAWRHSEQVLTPQRLKIRQVARALLVHPRHLPYNVVAAVADGS